MLIFQVVKTIIYEIRNDLLRILLKIAKNRLFLRPKRKYFDIMEILIKKIKVGGITNIKSVEIPMEKLTALVAPNNYGKSNFLVAIEFAVQFMAAQSDTRLKMMSTRNVIPINKSMEDAPFSFEMEGSAGDIEFVYGFSFEWARTNGKDHGSRVVSEILKLKQASELKYKAYIKRDDTEHAYIIATSKGRCNKEVLVDRDILVMDKLLNMDGLFYLDVVKAIRSINVKRVNTLDNPDGIFSSPYPASGSGGYSVSFPKPGEIGFFINSLRQLDVDKYELLKNTIVDLLPNIEDFEPVQVDLSPKTDVPFQLPNTYFDIRVKERFNNQYTSINNVSTGSKKILYVLTMSLAASLNHVDLLMFEELENSVHPRLLQNLLQVVTELAGNTKVITTSHSPYLVKYLSPNNIQLGLPTHSGVAEFKTIKPSKVNKVLRQASAEEVSIGEYLFDMMLDAEADDEMLNEYFA